MTPKAADTRQVLQQWCEHTHSDAPMIATSRLSRSALYFTSRLVSTCAIGRIVGQQIHEDLGIRMSSACIARIVKTRQFAILTDAPCVRAYLGKLLAKHIFE